MHLSSSNGRAFPYLVSRFPGTIPLFPELGDFTLTVKIRFDHITPWGTVVVVLQTQSTDPSGTNAVGQYDDVLLQIAGDYLYSALGQGGCVPVAPLPSPYEVHEVTLDCIGNAFTIGIDGQVVYGPVTSTLRPTVVWMGNPSLAYWYPTDWEWFSVDDIRIDVPGGGRSPRGRGAQSRPCTVTESDCTVSGLQRLVLYRSRRGLGSQT